MRGVPPMGGGGVPPMPPRPMPKPQAQPMPPQQRPAGPAQRPAGPMQKPARGPQGPMRQVKHIAKLVKSGEVTPLQAANRLVTMGIAKTVQEAQAMLMQETRNVQPQKPQR